MPPKYVSIPMKSYNMDVPDVPILLPFGEVIMQEFGFGNAISYRLYQKKSGQIYSQQAIGISTVDSFNLGDSDIIKYGFRTYDGGPYTRYWTLPFVIEPKVYPKSEWCKVSAYDTTIFPNPSYPIVVFFKAFQRKIEQQNVVVKYDDEVGTIIPLSQKQFDVLTFTTQPMNADYARLLLDVAEWDNVTFQHWDTKNNAWSTAINVAKKAESWQKTTYPKTLGTTIQGSFVIKQ